MVRNVIRPVAAALVMLVPVAAAGCGDGAADGEAMRAGFAAVAAAVDVDDLDGPNETTSKDVTYLTGRGVVADDPQTAADRAVAGLQDAGWEVTTVGPAGGDDGGVRVVAELGDVATQIAVHTALGVNTAPDGSSFMQIAVAPTDAGLDWTN